MGIFLYWENFKVFLNKLLSLLLVGYFVTLYSMPGVLWSNLPIVSTRDCVVPFIVIEDDG